MNLQQAQRLLGYAAEFDPRLTATKPETWTAVLDQNMTEAQGHAAIDAFYADAEGDPWLWPGNLNVIHRRKLAEHQPPRTDPSMTANSAEPSCRRPGCLCDHTKCHHGILDELVTTDDGYKHARPCPACQAAKQ